MANGAAAFSYFMNFNGLDRYRRLGIDFVFDAATKQYHYDGASWREIVRRYPRSAEAAKLAAVLNCLRQDGRKKMRDLEGECAEEHRARGLSGNGFMVLKKTTLPRFRWRRARYFQEVRYLR